MMTGMNGVEDMADAQARGHGQGDGTVFVMLTALDDDDEVRRAVMAGADDYITKPFDVTDLADRLERWCGATGWELIDPTEPGEVHDHLLFDHPGAPG
jgi:DNA-binding response OmpR family regulator